MIEEWVTKEILVCIYEQKKSAPDLLKCMDLRDARLIPVFNECIQKLKHRGYISETQQHTISYYSITDEGKRKAESYNKETTNENIWLKILAFLVLVIAISTILYFVFGGNNYLKSTIDQNNDINNGDLVIVETDVVYTRGFPGMPAYNTQNCHVLKGAQLCVLRNPERIDGELWFYVREIGGSCEGWIPKRERSGRENVVYNSKCR